MNTTVGIDTDNIRFRWAVNPAKKDLLTNVIFIFKVGNNA